MWAKECLFNMFSLAVQFIFRIFAQQEDISNAAHTKLTIRKPDDDST
ncbi:hypothetical protein BH09BAC4_BH09BAC4_46120 [soil metagenome]